MKKQIDNQCKSLYKEKLRVMNYIARKLKKENRKFELVDEQKNLLKDLNEYLINIMKNLWKQPKIVVSILKKADPDNELKNYLAPLFVNNFYENILSSYYIEDNLMYVLTLLLKDEINNLNSIDNKDTFLNGTTCGYLLEEFKRKKDIQTFFKNIIINAIENLELNHSDIKLDFNISNLTQEYKRQNSKDTKQMIKSKTEGYLHYSYSSFNIKSNEKDFVKNKKNSLIEQENFTEKYIPTLDNKTLGKKAEEFKNDKRMHGFFASKLNDCKLNKYCYSNELYLENLYKSEFSKEILLIYLKNFTLVISFINSIMEKLATSFHLFPYSLRCLCKIISILLKKKFPTINETEENAFISKFFFGKLLTSFLKNPEIEAFISNFIISKNTIDNLKIIGNIIDKFTSADFYINEGETSNYTPFNWFFIEKMEELINIFDRVTKAKLPSFIEKLINDELPPDYEYDYFKEHPDEIINYSSICINLKQIDVLLNIMNNNKENIFIEDKYNNLEKTMEILLSKENQSLFNNILISEDNKKSTPTNQNTSKDKIEIESKVHYILITELLINKRCKQLFRLEKNKEYFFLKEIKTDINEETIIKNNIIKVKNFFCSILYNYNKLVKTDFDEGTTENTIAILKELNKLMKSSNFVVDGSIPSEWYVNSLLECLENIPKDFAEKDFEKLFDEMENDINKSIKELDFEVLSLIPIKLKYTKKGQKYYEDCINLLKDIKLNKHSKKIIEEEFTPIEIRFNLNENFLDILEEYYQKNNLRKSIRDKKENIGEFEIILSNFKERDKNNIEKIKEYEKSKNNKLCLNIDSFIKKFPNLVKYQEKQDADIFLIQKLLDIPDKIKTYFNFIGDILEEKGRKNIKQIKEIISDYVMTKIYDKIYPKEPYDKDSKIFEQTVKLSWIELKHFSELKKKIVFGNFLSDVSALFNLINKEKSPRKKLLNLKEIYNSIGFLLIFNGVGPDFGVDDQLPILNYALVKTRPLRLYSDTKYMELYIGEKKKHLEGSLLIQLLTCCQYIADIKSNDLINVTEEEFKTNCLKATKEDI